MKKVKNIRGFTMLETMIVVTIFSILATLAILGYRNSIAHQKIVGEHKNLLAAMRFIADEARVSKKQIKVTVSFRYDSLVAWVDANDNSSIDAGEKIIQVLKTQKGVDFWSGYFAGTIKKGRYSSYEISYSD